MSAFSTFETKVNPKSEDIFFTGETLRAWIKLSENEKDFYLRMRQDWNEKERRLTALEFLEIAKDCTDNQPELVAKIMFKFLDFIHIPKEPEVEIYRPKPEQDKNYGEAIEPPEDTTEPTSNISADTNMPEDTKLLKIEKDIDNAFAKILRGGF